MQKAVLQKTLPYKDKCIYCQKRKATDADGLCDHCRFMATLQAVTRKEEK